MKKIIIIIAFFFLPKLNASCPNYFSKEPKKRLFQIKCKLKPLENEIRFYESLVSSGKGLERAEKLEMLKEKIKPYQEERARLEKLLGISEESNKVENPNEYYENFQKNNPQKEASSSCLLM